MAPADPPVGALVEYAGLRGIVRFFGTTQFSPGKWVGIELFENKGKNDGSVQGKPYFSCRPNYGVFVRVSQVTVIESEPQQLKSSTRPASMLPPARPVGHQRTPSHSQTGASALSRSTTARSLQSAASRAETPPSKPTPLSIGRPPLQSPVKRTPSLRQPLPPPTPSSSHSAFPSRRVASPPPTPREEQATPVTPVQLQPSVDLSTPPRLSDVSPVVLDSPIEEPSIDAQELAALRQEDQELKTRLRLLEAKRADDQQRIRELESRLADAENFVALRPKLQAKLNQLQTELVETRRTLADQNDLNALSESKLVEAGEQLEMAMLDKEVAEERAEAAEAEMESLKEQLAIFEVELKVIKEAGDGGDGGDGEGGADPARTTLAYIQLERHNERLKEALVRLRDISHEAETEQRHKIQELERDLASLDDMQSQYENTLSKLENADIQIEELKLQLDDALGAEEMLVQLTERNLMLGEKIEEMRIIIEDLEALKELGDELEENHVETEKAMQEEIDTKDIQIRDQANKIDQLEENLQDYEQTINQFRDLVVQLQGDLEALRAQNQTVQTESQAQATQSAAMMTLNLKLQSSALKNQAKTIDLELRRIEAREGRELLAIVQPYLPQIYIESDSDATNCYLFFQRLAAKADLINSIVGQIHGLPESLNGPISETLAAVCEMRGRISYMSCLCKRFAAVLRRCDVESFLNIGRVYADVAPMEKRIDMHIDLLKRDEFREIECVSDIHKMVAQFDHLAELYFAGFEHDLGERELSLATSFDSDLDMFAAAIGLTRTALNAHIKEEEAVVQTDDLDIDEQLFTPLQQLQDQCKSAKVMSRKLVKRIEDLLFDSNALKPYLTPNLNSLTVLVSKAVDFGIQLAQKVGAHLAELRQSKAPLKLTSIIGFVRELAIANSSKLEGSPTWEVLGDTIKQIVQDVGALMPTALESENVIKITGISPWVARVDEIKAAAAVNVEAERKVGQLSEELQELVRSIKARDQTIQESSVKIELMERRLEGVKRQGDAIVELESDLAKARKQEKAYEEAMEQLQADLDALEQENVKLKQAAPAEKQALAAQQPESEAVTLETNLETSHLLEQIDSLRGTVRFLRQENSYLKGQDLLKEIRQLPDLPSYTPPPLTPPDSPTSSASSEGPVTPPTTLRSLALETKTLYRDVIAFSSAPKVVDLSALNKRKTDGGPAWIPMRDSPAHQLLQRKRAADELSRKVRALRERAEVVTGRSS
ncbi:hypothetical protein EXIGLDRAFT_632417 [Exidia glandulosa HHB12029]|uniref:CAP-Gly domain-containing protein n=1 Tax=Exidia glandulosa HHB12029 TaxID=1314781 RepID=A0A166NIM7_EXIGL|nr:hypothetical protein EXIGLDRAFT_632417 [Exidia glandulosa HHB12029]